MLESEPPNERVHSFDMADRWMVAEEPLHWLADSTDPVHWRKNAQGQPVFKEKFKAFVEALRRGFGQPDPPFYYVQ